MNYPKSITELIESYQKLPGIGKKTAERLAFYTINRLSQDDVESFSDNLLKVKSEIFYCSVCGNITDTDPCSICTDDTRSNDTLVIIEEAKDLIALEKMGNYKGKYHVLGGTISAINGRGPEDIKLKELINRLKNENIKEIIIATNATIEGESTAMYINRLLEKTGILITRIAHGLPVGSNLDYADNITLLKAMEGRRKL